jgi:hypothetical protein
VKAGTENRTKVIAAIILGLVAVLVIATQFAGWFSGNSSSAAAPVPTASTDPSKPSVPAPRNLARIKNTGSKQSNSQTLDPTLRLGLLKASEDTKYEGTGRNIFKVFVEIPKPVVSPVKTPAVVAQQPPPPPPPPPSNLKFYGFATPQGGTKRIFLTKNEDVFIAKEGDIVDRRYKVVRISPTAVEILDVLSNNRENIPLTPS